MEEAGSQIDKLVSELKYEKKEELVHADRLLKLNEKINSMTGIPNRNKVGNFHELSP